MPMSIEEQSTIDAIGIDQDGKVVLTISNHLEWNSEHLFLLQEKINAYIAFIESGEIFTSYPDSKGKTLKINTVCKYEPNIEAKSFLSQCESAINQAGVLFGYEVLI